jgi:hypothetical protein
MDGMVLEIQQLDTHGLAKRLTDRRDNVFLIMDQSLVYRHIHFLRELGQANKTTRKLLVHYMMREQMEALAEVAGYFVRSIRVLPQDVTHVRERSLILRQVIRRKRNTLVTYHNVVPRLLRSHYLNRAVVLSIR